MSFGKLGVNLGGEIGHASLWRHGLWKKGLFWMTLKATLRNLII